MPLISSDGFAHVRITVTDIARSKSFYDDVFGWPVVIDRSADVDQPGIRESADDVFGGTVYQTPSGALFGLRPVGADQFDSERTGLDHVSFLVGSRADLEAAESGLEALGTPHGQVRELTDSGIAILSFSDPDGVHLELTAPLA